MTDELSLPPEAERELEAMAQVAAPPEGHAEAQALHTRIRDTVEEHNADIRALLGRKFSDEEWTLRGGPLTTIFIGLEVQLDMLRECPSTTLVHVIGFSTVHVHHLIAQMIGVAIGSPEHIAVVSVVSAALEGRVHAGPKSVQ